MNRRRLFLLMLCVATVLNAQNLLPSWLTQSFPGSPVGAWWENGGLFPTSSILTSSGNLSLISQTSAGVVPDEYEVRTKYQIRANGGSYVTYLRASSNSQLGGGGTFYAVELTNVDLSGGACVGTVALWKVVNGVHDLRQVVATGCQDGMTLRFLIRWNGIFVVKEGLVSGLLYWTDPDPITSGRPGVGVRGTSTDSGITSVSFHHIDRDAPSTPGVPAVSVVHQRAEISWPGVYDGTQSSGLWTYIVDRRQLPDPTFQTVGWARRPSFQDLTLPATAGTQFEYCVYARDNHLNLSAGRCFTVTTQAPNVREPRRTGLRPEGTYWGGGGVQIDIQSGNMNFTIPLLSAQGRNGLGATFLLTSNSQMWRRDAGAQTWNYGKDVGYGFGWRLSAGSLTPIFRGLYDIAFYVFIDSTGAEFRLDQRDVNGVWTGREGFYASYDENTRKLWFNDGTFWQMDSEASDAEEDAGTFYPTAIQDPAGNQIAVNYRSGWFAGATNTSGRILDVRDLRAGADPTWAFLYAADGTGRERLTEIRPRQGLAGMTFQYHVPTSLVSPWGEAIGQTMFLYRVANTTTGQFHEMWYEQSPAGTPNLTGELNRVILPLGGRIRWDYRDFTYTGQRVVREVQTRYLQDSDSTVERQHNFFRQDALDATESYHQVVAIWDPLTPPSSPTTVTEAGDRAYWFNSAGLLQTKQERGHQWALKAATDNFWATSAAGHLYLQSSVSRNYEPGGQAFTQTTQAIDEYGNVTSRVVTNFNGVGTTREWQYSYLHNWPGQLGPLYRDRYVRNRMTEEKAREGSSGAWSTLRQVWYDSQTTPGCGWQYLNLPMPPPVVGQPPPVVPLWVPGPQTGQLTDCVFGLPSRVQSASGVAVSMSRYRTGVVESTIGPDGTKSQTVTADSQWAAPSTMTAQGQTTSLVWDSVLRLGSVSGPNGGAAGTTYDYAGRPTGRSLPDGQAMAVAYSGARQHISTETMVGITDGAWTRTTMDGFGRPRTVERGYGVATGAAQSVVEYQYEPCACSPFGKLKRESVKRQPGTAAVWTVRNYDILGRTVRVDHPGGGATSYEYDTGSQGGQLRQSVKVTLPGGARWKKHWVDGFGNLREVEEPRPGVSGVSDFAIYSYDWKNRLTTVSMTRPGYKNGNATPQTLTQTRSFEYDADGRTTKTVFPETGETRFEYDALGRPVKKVDARGRKITFEYDSNGRLKFVRRYPTEASTTEDGNERVEYFYDSIPAEWANDPAANFGGAVFQSLNGAGRVVAIRVGWSRVVEFFDYTDGGQLARKRVVAGSNPSRALEVSYGFDTKGRVETMTYPSGRKFKYTHGVWGRPSGVVEMVKLPWEPLETPTPWPYGVGYGWHEGVTGMTTQGAYPVESLEYNSLLQMTRYWGGGRDISYNYSWPAGYNDGRLVSQTNNLGGGSVTSYGYDELGRLSSASATGSSPWSQTYIYDGFGNLAQKTGTQASDWRPAMNSAKNQVQDPAGGAYDAVGNYTLGSATFDYDNRLRTLGSGMGMVDTYDYAADGKRVFKTRGMSEEITLYVGNQRIATYGTSVGTSREFVYLAGRKLVYTVGVEAPATEGSDRLGSAVAHLPYGEELSSTAEGRTKFATYWRDESGFDYADQRYYTPGSGRFLSADPYQASAGAAEPGAWNRYAYVVGDPVNAGDPQGLYAEQPDPSNPGGFWESPGFGDPFEGLGSGAWSGWERPRRLACLSAACLYWSSDSSGRATAAGLAVGGAFVDASTAGNVGKLAVGICVAVPEVCIGAVVIGAGIALGELIFRVVSLAADKIDALCLSQAYEMDPKNPNGKPPGDGWTRDEHGDWVRSNPDGTTEKIHPDFDNGYGEAPHWDWNIYTPPGKGGSSGWKIWPDGSVTPAGKPKGKKGC